MGEWDVFRAGSCRGSCLFLGLILSSVCVSIEGQSISGFLSIDCGATSQYKDAVTNFPWEGDSKYTSTGMSGQVPLPVNTSFDNYEALQTFRYFPDRRSKHCYELPTTGNTSVLLRAMFLHGSAPELMSLPLVFDIAVNDTVLLSVTYDWGTTSSYLSTPISWEGIVFSPGRLIHFCLVTHSGVPFISSLEVRELDPNGAMYSFEGSTGLVLRNVWRFNCGAQLGTPTARYPDDPFDRLWLTPGDWASGFPSSTGEVATYTKSSANNVPPKVMQNAWNYGNPDTTVSVWFPLDKTVSNVYMAIYYEEIIANSTLGDRMFRIDMNGETEVAIAPHFAYEQYYQNWNVSNLANFTFTGLKSIGSKLGPIINAIEIYAVYPFTDSATAPQDVDALASLQVSFNLTDWQGDPCYPVPWDWVGCTADTQARVDTLLLSSVGLKATIPPSISNLDALTQIHLDNNHLYGTIPDSLALLPHLTFLSLKDNDLSGTIPSDLITKLGTKFYYSGNGLLGGVSPSSSPNSTPTTTTTKKSTNVGIIAGIAGGLVGLVVLVILIRYLCSTKRKKVLKEHGDKVELGFPAKQTASISALSLQQVNPYATNVDHLPTKGPVVKLSTEVGQVSYETVKVATDNFKVKIGQGSFGTVYHGLLNNTEVAVKINSIQSDQGHDEFITEVDILTRVHHRNLVSLIAYCNEGNKLILIYEFEVNGTLQAWLHNDGENLPTLDWKRRLQIAIDGAKGLEYLHKGCEPTIIHRDVKSSNILLDSAMNAKVCDFGLSKSTPGETTTGYTTFVKGTPGYVDPEYHHLGRLTHKSDVYSYGVVLAEILTGLPPYIMQAGGPPIVLVERVRKLVDTNDIEALADPKLQGAFNRESMWRMADITLSCIDPEGVTRPDFTQVVRGIREAIELEKTFTLHSPIAPSSGSYILRSNSSNRYQTLP